MFTDLGTLQQHNNTSIVFFPAAMCTAPVTVRYSGCIMSTSQGVKEREGMKLKALPAELAETD